jgi:hypothetical protein
MVVVLQHFIFLFSCITKNEHKRELERTNNKNEFNENEWITPMEIKNKVLSIKIVMWASSEKIM